MLYYKQYTCKIGSIYIVCNDESIVRLLLDEEQWSTFNRSSKNILIEKETPLLKTAFKQLNEYFLGERTIFTLPLDKKGTPFQQQVWEALQEIPYGKTCSYQEVATRVNNPKAVRAIGQANRANPFPIIVPCHRVIGKNKNLTGYAGNKVHIKEMLLSIEEID
ncbi:methylated-DNA--[protein]-cysteine S-methyltransferase [Bacillus sp. AK128]